MSDIQEPLEVSEESLNEQMQMRRHKLAELRKLGQAFPNQFRRDSYAKEIHEQYESKSKESLEESPVLAKMAGRIMTRRLMGKASFIHIQDMTGQMQIYLRKDDLPDTVYESFKHWDLGDIVGVEGALFKTKTNELSLKASNIQLLTKSLRPLPEKYHGLADVETCYRQRYLDLMTNAKTKERFAVRSQIIQCIREFLMAQKFAEVETPMMQAIVGGAVARPFITHHNALDMPLYLRIAPELYLKRLVVGGIERVFEINRNFRNEGLSTRHNPEFTMLEFYQAYADFIDLMNLTESMMRTIAEKVLGTTQLPYQGKILDFGQPFKRMTVRESIVYYNPDLKGKVTDYDALWQYAEKLGVHLEKSYGLGKLQIEIFEKTVESQLFEPTFITEYPTEVSPLARKNDQDPTVTDRFEFFVGGREIANGFSELNDPEDQAERFMEQVALKEAGDQEAMHFDQDYITALEYGLPPTAGEGIGIDRLVMLFTDTDTIRDVIFIPIDAANKVCLVWLVEYDLSQYALGKSRLRI